MTKYFVTGATGFIGSAVVEELIKNGYQVVGLARSDKSAEKLAKAGAESIRGDLEDLESLKKGVREADGVIHLGFVHDFANFDRCCDIDYAATKAMLSALEGTDKPFVWTTGLLGFITEIGTKTYETDAPDVSRPNKRLEAEALVLDAGKKGSVKSTVIRLAPTVHGKGDIAFIPALIGLAKKNGVVYYIGEGKNTWSAVHRRDAAVAFRLAAEKGVAGSAYNASADVGIETKAIAETFGKKFNLPVESIPQDRAFKELGGFFGFAFGANMYASTEKLQALGWEPKEIGLLEDIEQNYTIDQGDYFLKTCL